MKKLICAVALTVAAALLLCACTSDKNNEDTTADTTDRATLPVTDAATESQFATEEDTTLFSGDNDDSSDVGSEGALQAAREYLGDRDEDTGYEYTYSFDGTVNDNGTEKYKIRVSWFIEEEGRSSLCGYLLVSKDGSKISKFDW